MLTTIQLSSINQKRNLFAVTNTLLSNPELFCYFRANISSVVHLNESSSGHGGSFINSGVPFKQSHPLLANVHPEKVICTQTMRVPLSPGTALAERLSHWPPLGERTLRGIAPLHLVFADTAAFSPSPVRVLG